MANEATILRIRAQVENLEGLNRVRSAVRNFANESKIASNDLDKLYSSLKQLNTESVRSVNNLQNYRNGLDSLRKSAEIGGTTFNKLTSEIKQLDIQLGKLQTRQASGVGAVNKIGQSIGAVAAAGVFGGPEGLIGAGIGAIGGPGGALAGGAIGAQLGMIRQSIGATAEYAAQVDKLNIALKSVAGTSSEYANAQSVIATSAKALNIPVLDSTQSFTRLAASVKGAGGKISDAQIVFNGVASAIKATGGSAEDIQGAILAMSQTFSKGKVSAEELSGQLGERLPGAVTLFAEATGRTLPQLSKDLQNGAVGLNDLMKFAIALNEKYAASALAMAGSTEEAGARMQVAIDAIKYSFGELFKPLGAQLQDAITGISTLANTWIQALSAMAKQNAAFISSPAFSILVSTLSNVILPGSGGLGGVVKNLADYGKGTRSAQQRLTAAGSTTMYADESGNIYDTATGKLMFPGRSGVTNFPSPKIGDTVGGGTKTAENAAKRLADRTKEQLIVSKQLIDTEQLRLNVNKAGSAIDKAKAENLKIQGATQDRFNNLLRKSLSDQERDNIMTAKRIANRVDEADGVKRIAAATKEQNKELAEQNRQLYAQSGLLDILTEKRQAALAGAFTGGTATGTFRTDVDLMPGLTGGKLGEKIEELRKELETLADPINQIIAGAEAIGQAFSTSFTGLINGSMSAQQSLASFFQNIANYFLDMASKMIAKYIEMQIIGLASKLLPSFSGIFGPGGAPDYSGASVSVPNQYSYSANGNVFAQNGIVPYAKGGIVDRPMMFPFAKGIGLMGEAGPEAIMPLKRGADGKLGVAGGGGGGTSVTVNVDASGSSVQGDQAQSRQLGVAISAAVQAELVKQKRPGGLLAK